MGGDPWIYSAVFWSIFAGIAGLSVGAYAIKKISGNDNSQLAAPTLFWLVVGMACVAFAVTMEQTRVLIYRLSYDGLIDRSAFDVVYDMAFFVAGTKILAAVAIAGSAALKLALLCGKSDEESIRWGAIAGVMTAVGWLLLAIAMLPFF